MIRETFFPDVDKTVPPFRGRWKQTNEGGTYYDRKSGNRIPRFIRYKDANTKSKFEAMMAKRGKAMRWAYDHNIGLYGRILIPGSNLRDAADYKARAKFIGSDSFYDEENFFMIKMDENSTEQRCQLRVSDHPVNMERFQTDHSEAEEVQCDTCLNIMIGADNIVFSKGATFANCPHKLTIINCTLDIDNTPAVQLGEIDAFIKDIQRGTQDRIVTLDEIKHMFGEENVNVEYGGGEEMRENQFKYRGKNTHVRQPISKWEKEEDEIAAQQQANQQPQIQEIPESIPIEEVHPTEEIPGKKGITYKKFYYGDRFYAFDEPNMVAYPIKTKGGISLKNPVKIVKPLKISFDDIDLNNRVEINGKTYYKFQKNDQWYAFDEDDSLAYPINAEGELDTENGVIVEHRKRRSIIISEAQRRRIFEVKIDNNGQLTLDFDNPEEGIGQDEIKKKGFQPTEAWVKEKYDYYNNLVWNGELPPFEEVNFSFKNLGKSVLGAVRCLGYTKDKEAQYEGVEVDGCEWYPKGVELYLTNQLNNQTEKGVLDTLVHEMCHIYENILEPQYKIHALLTKKYNKDYPKHGHGKVFFEQARKLDKFGFNVQQVATAEEIEGLEVIDNNYNWYIVIFKLSLNENEEQTWYFDKVFKNGLKGYIESIENFEYENYVPDEVYVYSYRGTSDLISTFKCSKKYNPFNGFYPESTLLKKTDFGSKQVFVQKIKINYNSEDDNFGELIYNNRDKITQYVIDGYYKKVAKGRGVFQDVVPDLTLRIKLSPKTTLKVSFAPYIKFNNARIWVYNNTLAISNTEESDLGIASEWIYEDFVWKNTHDRDNEDWQAVEETIEGLIYDAIDDYISKNNPDLYNK